MKMKISLEKLLKSLHAFSKDLNTKAVCHDCGIEEGQLHKPGCDMERCPKCLGQLISRDCSDDEPDMLPRIPWVEIPNLCALCGEVFPKMFNVQNGEWEKFVIPSLQGELLCRDCYNWLKKLFPNGWMNAGGEGVKKK